MKILNLDLNPLERLPDFSTMPNLRGLNLRRTRINTWPTGLSNQPLERIDLRDNRLTDVPDSLIDPPPQAARATSRLNSVTLLQGNPLTEAARQRLSDYWTNLRLLHPDWATLSLPGHLAPKWFRWRCGPRVLIIGCSDYPERNRRAERRYGNAWSVSYDPRSFSSC